MTTTKNHAVLLVHLSTALFALSAVFAKNMEVSVTNIVSMRALLAALALGLVLAFFKKNQWRRLSVKEWGHLITLGGLLALHWLCFFIGVIEAGIAVGTLGFACFPVFVALINKTLYGTIISKYEWLCISVIIVGLSILSLDSFLDSDSLLALAWAIASGASYAVILVYNQRVSVKGSAIQSSWIQFVSCGLFALPFGISSLPSISADDVVALIVIGFLCTGVAYTVLTKALQSVPSSKAAVVITLEPVWAILFAALLGTVPTVSVLIGGGLIIAAVTARTLKVSDA